MKSIKTILVLISLLGFANLHGQFFKHFGVKAGMSLSNQSLLFTSPTLETQWPTDVLLSPGILFFLESFKGEKVSMQIDLGYMGKGFRTTTHSITIDHLNNDSIIINEGPETFSRFHYLSFAPMVRYRHELEKVVFYTLLGPRIDWLKSYFTTSEYPLEQQNEVIIGLTGAFGFEYKLDYLTLDYLGVFAEIQYQADLSPLTNKAPLLVNNDCLLLSVGVRF